MNNVATLVKTLASQSGVSQSVYRMSPPLRGNEFVMVSASTRIDVETYIFGSDENGDRTAGMVELPGSQKGTLDHAVALWDAGYMLCK